MKLQEWQTLAQNRAVTITEMAAELAQLREQITALRNALGLIGTGAELALTCDDYGKAIWLDNIMKVANQYK